MSSSKPKSTRTVEARVLLDFWHDGERLRCNSVAVLNADVARDLAAQGLVDLDAAAVAAADQGHRAT